MPSKEKLLLQPEKNVGVLVPVVLFACIPILRKGLSRKAEPEPEPAN